MRRAAHPAHRDDVDVIVVGSGPNGLAAAIECARAGRSVRLYEAASTVGGGTRSAELTLPGFVHDVCAAAHPLAVASPFFRAHDLARFGLEWIQPPIPVAHALEPGRTVALERTLDPAALEPMLGPDANAWARLFGPLVRELDGLLQMVLAPLTRPPRHPLLLARFAVPGMAPATALARLAFRRPAARALFGGLAAHSMLRVDRPVSASFGLLLGALGHAVGWPLVRGGTGRIASALEARARELGVEIVTEHRVRSLRDLPQARAIMLNLTPRQVLEVASDRLPAGYRRQLAGYRYGAGVFRIDWALSGPIPWGDVTTAAAGTVHLGGPLEEVAASESASVGGRIADRPFVLLVQPTLFDPTRAPAGRHIAWAYCHVPHGSQVDMTTQIEAQVERFAPGFRDLVLARSTRDAPALEAYDANYVGGDINGGIQDLRQALFRPVVRPNPYTTPNPRLFLCSSATPPGGGVHGMSGLHAAREVLRRT